MDAYHKSPFFHKLVETIHNICRNNIFTTGRRKSALRFCKRRLSQEFMAHAISPMLETLNVPLQLAIGITRRIYTVIIIPTLLVNDNKEAWSLLNFITRSRHRSCRLCNAKYLHELGVKSDDAFLKQLTGSEEGRCRRGGS
jgi:hypothetical protein